MYKQKTIKTFSIIAIVLSIIGLLTSILITFFLMQEGGSLKPLLSVVSWVLLLWASIIGFKLCTKYELYEEEYKKVGIRIYLIIIAFILFFFVGLMIGLLLSVLLLSALWGLKSNYDDWAYQNTTYVPEETDTIKSNVTNTDNLENS